MPGGSRSRSRSADKEYSSSSRRRSSRSPSRRSSSRKESRYESSSRHRDDDRHDSDRTRDRDRDERRSSSRRDREDDSRRRDDRESKESSSRSDRERERDRDRDRDRDRESGRSSSSRQRRRHHGSESGSDRGGERSDDDRRGRSSKKEASSSRKKPKRETSEERALRKEARKKEKDELNKTVEMALANYSNADNPFNDANLGQKFVWAKKREVEKKKGISKSESARRDAERREEAIKELEKLNRKRIEREREREEREEELQRIQRMSEQAQLGDWQAKEDEFHLEQAKRRAEIRIKNSRAKPIDILAINVKMIGDDRSPEEIDEEEEEEEDLGFEIEVEEPYTIFENLSLEEVEELHQDIKFYLSLDKHESSREFWRAMLIVCDDKLAELKRRPDEKSAVAPRIIEDITRMLDGKSLEQLQLLQGQFRSKLNSGGAIEVEYWETALRILIVWIAKVKLQQMHQMVLERRLEQLKRRQQREAQKETAQLAAVLAMQSQDVHGDTSLFDEAEERVDDEDDLGLREEEQAAAVYDRSMSPEPIDRIPQEDALLEVVDPDEDWQRVVEQRRKVMLKQFNPKKRAAQQGYEEHPDDAFVAKVMYEKEAAKNVGGPMEVEGDETNTFNTDAPLQQQTYMWQDKYRPRKPRFFNRVHTGYEWNKYNQTHYDHDNPPPKIVQGYKFNIFYPDLIDKSKAPTYVIEREPGNKDTVLIRFKAGPPYEDIAFRIVSREWEHSHKRGFKSVFDRGVLQLHFNFKRQFYRR
ncbi:hypothetical protein DFQ26_004968 [Actinomortierella ambigua]|nr:hypothetical protein DFQ26_004968 [Actinomortierella ambigua]